MAVHEIFIHYFGSKYNTYIFVTGKRLTFAPGHITPPSNTLAELSRELRRETVVIARTDNKPRVSLHFIRYT